MWSTRARLAAAYAGLLLATLIVFCAALYFARRASAYEDLAERAVGAANQLLGAMAVSEQSGRRLTLRDSSKQVREAEHDSVWVVRVSPLPELRNMLEARPGYFLVLDERSRVLYSSFAFRQLPTADQDSLIKIAVDLVSDGSAALVPVLQGHRMLMVARDESTLKPNISRVIAALPTTDAEVPAQLLLGTILLLAPLFMLLSVALAYGLAGNTFKPVDTL